jgi:glucokinase
MHYLGVDIGGTTIKAGLVDARGGVTAQSRIPTVTDNWDAFLSNITALIRKYQAEADIEAVGMGVPGFRNRHTRRVVASPNIPCLTDVSLERLVADEVHIPVVTENDANAAAYCEFVCGLGQGLQHMAYLTLGTGLGSGIILDGKLFGGASGYAAEFGHTVIQPGGRPCHCGSVGCLETLVSAQGILRTALELIEEDPASSLHAMAEQLNSKTIFDASVAGDRSARATFERTGYWLGIACANLINTLNLQLIAIGGGVMAAGDAILKPLVESARRHAIAASFNDCRIVQSELWPDAGVIGAAMLARDR